MKFYFAVVSVAFLLSSCLKQSIPDAMLHKSNGKKITATLSYQINGTPVTVSVADADNPAANNHQLECVKTNIYVLSAIVNPSDFIFTFFTDSLKTINYQYTNSMLGDWYVTTFNSPQYIHGPLDNMSFNVTSYQGGHISGNFTGRLTPLLMPGTPNIWGVSGSTLITNGSFNNVPVRY